MFTEAIEKGKPENQEKSKESVIREEKNPSEPNEERKFIPLIDFQNTNGFVPQTGHTESEKVSTETITTHIQRIAQTTIPNQSGTPEARTVRFPYVYERKNDPRTRYIPLIPEEDLALPKSLIERDR